MTKVSERFAELVGDSCVLVTGGTGSFGRTFIGTCLSKTSIREIRVFSRDEQKHVAMQRDLGESRLRSVVGDVRDLERLRQVLRGVDFVFNAAALKHVHFTEEHPMEAVRTNVLGTDNVCRAALESGVRALVSLSTDKAVEPVNAMGMSKALHERVAVSHAGDQMRVGVVRYGNVLASNGSVVPFFKRMLEQGAATLPVTDRRMTRFVLTLEQSVDLVMRAFCDTGDGEIFAMDLPAFEIWRVAEVMASSVSRPVEVREVGIRPGEKLHETLISSEEMRRTTLRDGCYEIRRYRSAAERLPPADGGEALTSDRARLLDDEEIRSLLKDQRCLPRPRA